MSFSGRDRKSIQESEAEKGPTAQAASNEKQDDGESGAQLMIQGEASGTPPPQQIPSTLAVTGEGSDPARNVEEDAGLNLIARNEQTDLLTPNTEENTHDAPPTEEEAVVEGSLVPDPEEARLEILKQAVSATNVQAITTSEPKRNKWIPALIVVTLVVLAAIGVSLGVTLGRKNQDPAQATTESQTASPTMAPTQAPTSTRFIQVAALVESLLGTTLTETSSPQYKAAEWMANVDSALDLSTVESDRFLQRYALVVLYFSTGGEESWINQALFLTPDMHECGWFKTSREGAFSASGFTGVVICSEEGHVMAIEFSR